jgi:pyruvate,orthophosphate dikinase
MRITVHKTESTRSIFTFGAGRADGAAAQVELLGGKGAYLAEMSRLGLPVPPGFTIAAEMCNAYYAAGRSLPDSLKPKVIEALQAVGSVAGSQFGDVQDPLLVSVRSGSRASMPGMMDTVLNLGLNDETVEGLARRTGDRRFAYDTYRRFIQMYSDVVLGIDHDLFEEVLENYKSLNGFELDTELSPEHWTEVVERFKTLVKEERGQPFPQDLHEQLWGAIAAVFGSWSNARAVAYRRLHDIPEDWGTAVTVQAMVFGNMGERSATGVVFTRTLWRVPRKCPRGGRGGGTSHAPGALRKSESRDRRPPAIARVSDARHIRGAEAHLCQARRTFSRRAGYRVYR